MYGGVLGLVFVIALPALAQTYVLPSSVLPSANTTPVAPPLNSSASIQRKLGSLLIGPANGTAKICLNANSAADSARCVDEWSDVAIATGGPFLRYDDDNTKSGGAQAGNYQTQPGFVRIRAYCPDPSCQAGGRQYYSFLTAAATGLTSGGTPMIGATGLYATDGGSALNSAAYFSGRLHIFGTILNDNSITLNGELCLNGVARPDCIKAWTDLATGGGTFLELQTPANGVQAPTPNTGSVSLSGTGLFGSIVVQPSSVTPAISKSCGDGMCSNAENESTCAIDCAPILSLQNPTGVRPNTGGQFCSGDSLLSCANNPTTCTSTNKGVCQNYSGEIVVSTPTGQLPSGPVNVVVLRALNNPPSFVPVAGSTYTTGSVFGDSTIIYAGQRNQGLSEVVSHDRITAAGTYYYRAFIGNQYPRYGLVYTPLSDERVTYYLLSVIKTYTNGGTPVGGVPDQQISCGSGANYFCSGYYRAGTTVKIDAEVIGPGYGWDGWSGCQEPQSSTQYTCTVTANNNTSVLAVYRLGGGGGGTEF